MGSLRLLPLALCALVLAAAGCGSDRASRGEGSVDVAATTAPVGDFVGNAGGQRVRVTVLVPRGADPHSWRPGARARAAVASADLVIRSGGGVDAWLDRALAAAPDARVLTLLPKVHPLGADPHWWQDPVRVQRAVKEIRNELARVDVNGAGYYEAASADYLARLRKLDADTRRCIARVRGPRARVVARHDGFAYFSARYGVEVGAPRARRPGRAGPSGRAKAPTARGPRLWADTLAGVGSPAHSYLGAFAANVGAIVDALSAGRRSCRPEV